MPKFWNTAAVVFIKYACRLPYYHYVSVDFLLGFGL